MTAEAENSSVTDCQKRRLNRSQAPRMLVQCGRDSIDPGRIVGSTNRYNFNFSMAHDCSGKCLSLQMLF